MHNCSLYQLVQMSVVPNSYYPEEFHSEQSIGARESRIIYHRIRKGTHRQT